MALWLSVVVTLSLCSCEQDSIFVTVRRYGIQISCPLPKSVFCFDSSNFCHISRAKIENASEEWTADLNSVAMARADQPDPANKASRLASPRLFLSVRICSERVSQTISTWNLKRGLSRMIRFTFVLDLLGGWIKDFKGRRTERHHDEDHHTR